MTVSSIAAMAYMGVVFMAPVIIRSPMFCTLLSLEVFVLAAVTNDVEPYSKCGRTAPVYTAL